MIAMSAGHWKIGTGAVGIIDEVTEARKVVAEVSRLLKLSGLVVHTIIDDHSTTKQQNLAYLVKAHNSLTRKLDVSVHFNASAGTNQQAIGTEVLYMTSKMQPLAQQLSYAISKAGGLHNRGSKQCEDLFFLRNTTQGAVLIEVCFVNSIKDVELYHKHFHTICVAISNVLTSYVGGVTNVVDISSQTLQQKVQNLYDNKVFVQSILQHAIAKNVIQNSWINRYNSGQLTVQELCAIALLFVEKKYI